MSVRLSVTKFEMAEATLVKTFLDAQNVSVRLSVTKI